ncbi:MAG: GGDEF domain-containing protein [Solirubrobacteraceae bacterium]
MSDAHGGLTPVQLAEALHNAPIGTAICRRDGTILHANRALVAMMGTFPTIHASQATSIFQFLSPEDRSAAFDASSELLMRSGEVRCGDYRLNISREGVWVELSMNLSSSEHGIEPVLLVQLRDVTDRLATQQQLRYLADHDSLTGLPNRRRFEQELRRHVAANGRYGPAGALLILDIDNFKSVNDVHGHTAGDKLLRCVAQALTGRLRESDLLARLGGDEFAILMPRADLHEAETVARAALDAIRTAADEFAASRAANVTGSVGAALFEHQEPTPAAVLNAADLAMYQAKQAGGDRCALATPHARAAGARPRDGLLSSLGTESNQQSWRAAPVARPPNVT